MLAIVPQQLDRFLALCRKERCPCAVLGRTMNTPCLTLTDGLHVGGTIGETTDDKVTNPAARPIDIPLDFLFGNPPRMVRDVVRILSPPCNSPSRIDTAK